MKPIVTLTLNPTLDKSSAVRQVVADRKLRCDPPLREPGGGGLNVARVVGELGGEALALYTAGGFPGRMLSELLDATGVRHTPIPIAGETRENLMVVERSTGRQFRFGMPGPVLAAAEWQACLDALDAIEPAPDYIVASGSLPPGVPSDFYARVARHGRERGARVIVDTSGEALRPALEAGVFLVKPNARELDAFFPGERAHDIGLAEAARRVVENGWAEVVVLSLGAAGALLVSDGACRRIPSPAVEIVSKVGAGDSMVAGIVVALSRGEELGAAVSYGVAAGAAAVLTPGTALCRREDVDRLYAEIEAGARGRVA